MEPDIDLGYKDREFRSLDPVDKIRGALAGFIIGYALGDPRPHGITHLKMALDSLIEADGDLFPEDLAERLDKWHEESHEPREHLSLSDPCVAIARLIPYSIHSAVSARKLSKADYLKILAVSEVHKAIIDMGDLIDYFIQEVANGQRPNETALMIVHEGSFLDDSARARLGSIVSDAEIGNPGPLDGDIENICLGAIYCALRERSFERTIQIALAGGEAPRAAIAGMIYGLDIGESQIPKHLKAGIDKEILERAWLVYALRK